MTKQLSVVPSQDVAISDEEINRIADTFLDGMNEVDAVADAAVTRLNGAETMRTNLSRITQSMIVTLEKRRDQEDDRLKGMHALATKKAEILIDQATSRINELQALIRKETETINSIQSEITRSSAASEREVLSSQEKFNSMIVAQQVALKAIG